MARAGFEVHGEGKVLASLRAKSLKGVRKSTVRVIYDTPYALYVHEDLTANHPNGGQAKFLEEPFRIHRRTMVEMVSQSLLRKKALDEALEKAGKFLLGQSLPLVPVDTGALRDSGHVVVERHDLTIA
jgi:hypothetical protein